MSAPRTEAFELAITVQPDDIDELNHVNNVVYLKWVQDAAVAHWRTLATPAMQREALWVAVRHEIDYKHSAVMRDGIIARTWVGPAGRRTFERNTEILRAADRRVLARARTIWCPIDPTTFRPIDVSDAIRGLFSATD